MRTPSSHDTTALIVPHIRGRSRGRCASRPAGGADTGRASLRAPRPDESRFPRGVSEEARRCLYRRFIAEGSLRNWRRKFHWPGPRSKERLSPNCGCRRGWIQQRQFGEDRGVLTTRARLSTGTSYDQNPAVNTYPPTRGTDAAVRTRVTTAELPPCCRDSAANNGTQRYRTERTGTNSLLDSTGETAKVAARASNVKSRAQISIPGASTK
jgi:hypothetical protein